MNSYKSLALRDPDALADFDSSGLIFTHARKSRLLILGLLASFMVVFLYFNRFLFGKYLELQRVPSVFIQGQNFFELAAPYLVLGISWLAALAFLVYFLWAAIDIWGLQVTISQKRILVANTILGDSLRSWAKTGQLDLDRLDEIRVTHFQTRLSGASVLLAFSPVERLDLLMGLLIKNAPHARLVA